MPDVVDRIRASCARVAELAGSVSIDADAIAPYAAKLPLAQAVPDHPQAHMYAGGAGELAAFWLTLDAINFGSGWFPTLHKRPGASGYFTIAGGIRDRFDARGAWRAEELALIGSTEIAAVTGQDPEHELMAHFATSLNDLGMHLVEDYGGDFLGPVRAASGSAVALAEILAGWDSFADTSSYAGQPVPFLKRAQIAAADLDRCGAASFTDVGRLTMFADNLVPHVLRLDGLISFSADLEARIDRGEPIPHGSPEEVEIRACGLHVVELLAAERPESSAAEIDVRLWERGQGPAYKARPRHRSRCTAY